MKKLFIALLIFCHTLWANDEITLIAGVDRPPFVIDNANTGFEIELITQIFQSIDYKCQFISLPLGHSLKAFHLQGYDGVITTNKDLLPETHYLTDSYIEYQNVAISLSSNKLHIDRIAQLANYKIIAFSQADIFLGPRFKTAVGKAPLYFEIQDQSKQLKMLREGKADVLVMDRSVFHYFNETEQLDVTFHPLFAINKYHLAFTRQDLIKRFNNALIKFKNSKQYYQLEEKWQIK